MAPQSGRKRGLPGRKLSKAKLHLIAAAAQAGGLNAKLIKRIQKALTYFQIREEQGDMHGKLIGGRKAAGAKGCQPPGFLLNIGKTGGSLYQEKGKRKHFGICYSMKMGFGILLLCKKAVCIVHADLSAGIYAILSLPEFNEPGLALIRKINGQTVKDHVERDCAFVKQGGISNRSLPGVC